MNIYIQFQESHRSWESLATSIFEAVSLLKPEEISKT